MYFAQKITVLIVLIVLIVFITACGNKNGDTHYVEKSRDFLSENKLREALIEAKNALKVNAGDLEAHEILGKVYLKLGNPLLAEVEFEKLKQLAADKATWVPGLMKSYFLQSRFDELTRMEFDGLDKVTQSIVLSYKVRSLLKTGKIETAGELFEKLESYNVESNETSFAKASYLRKLNKHEEAKTILHAIIEREVNNSDAYVLLGNIEFEQKNYGLAEDAFSHAYSINPENKLVLMQRARARLTANNIELAQEDVNVLLRVYPQSPKVNMLQGVILVKQGMDDKALSYLEKSVKGEHAYPEALYSLAIINLKKGNIEQAESYSSRLLKIAPSLPSYILNARVQLKKELWQEAENNLRALLQKYPDNVGVLQLLARAHLGQGELSKAVVIYDQLFKLAPELAQSSLQLGVTLMAKGELSKSLEYLNKAVALEPDNTIIQSMVVLNYTFQKDFVRAEAAIKALKVKYPNRAFPYVLSSNIYNLRGEKEGAIKALKKGCEIERGHLDSCLNYAKSVLKDRDLKESERVYSLVLDENPNNYTSMIKLANISLLRGEKEKMVVMLNQAINKYPDVVEPKLLMGWYLYGERQLQSIAPLFDQLASTVKKNNIGYLELMATVAVDLKKFPTSTNFIKKILEIDPKHEKGLVLKAVANLGEGHIDQATSDFKAVLEVYPKNVMAKLMLAKVLVGQKKIIEAKVLIKELEKAPALSVEVLKLKSRIAEQSGDIENALIFSEEIINKAPTEKNMSSYIRLLWKNSKKEKVFSLLNDRKQQDPENVYTIYELVKYNMLQGNEDAAVSNLDAILKINPKHEQALNNAAWLLRNKDTKRALMYAVRLTDMVHGNPKYLDTLAVVQYYKGDIEKASRNIERVLAIEKAPTYIYHKAMIDNKKGDWLLAIKSLSSLLDRDIDFPEKKQAQDLLSELQAGS